MRATRRSALLALCILFVAPATWAQNTAHDVVIVGAGSAGLYAAKTLIADGYDVLIIEATDRRIFHRACACCLVSSASLSRYSA